MKVNDNPQITPEQLFVYLQAELSSHARAINTLINEVMPVATHSAELTGDSLVKTGPCIYYGYQVVVATATANIQVRDAISAGTGTVIGTIVAATAVGQYPLSTGIYCETGLYADYAGTATGTILLLFTPV